MGGRLPAQYRARNAVHRGKLAKNREAGAVSIRIRPQKSLCGKDFRPTTKNCDRVRQRGRDRVIAAIERAVGGD
jgi:hypothetical protein